MIKNTLAEIIFKIFYTKVSQMMTEIDNFKNIPPSQMILSLLLSLLKRRLQVIWRLLATEA